MASLGSGEVLARVVAFIGTTYLTRVLGPTGFGIVGLAAALCGYFTLAVRAGFDDIGARDVARHADRASQIAFGATIVRLLVAAVVFGLVAGLAALLDKPTIVKVVVILTGLSFFSFALDTGWVHKGLERGHRVGVALVAGQAAYVIALLVVVHQPADVIWVPVSQFTGELVAAAILIVPLLKAGAVRPDLREGVRLLLASGWVTLIRLLRTLIYTFDIVLIGFVLSEFEVGLYAAAYRLCFLILAIAAALHVAYLPALSRAAANGERLEPLAERSLELAAVISFPIVVGGGLIARPLLTSLFGAAYGAAGTAFALLLVSIGFVFFYGAIHNLAVVLHRTGRETRIIALAASTNVLLNVLLIPRYGIMAAAATTAFSEGLIVLLGLQMLRETGVHLSFRSVLRPAVAAVAMAAGLLVLGTGSSPGIAIAVGGGVYTLVLLLIGGLPRDVRALLR